MFLEGGFDEPGVPVRGVFAVVMVATILLLPASAFVEGAWKICADM